MIFYFDNFTETRSKRGRRYNTFGEVQGASSNSIFPPPRPAASAPTNERKKKEHMNYVIKDYLIKLENIASPAGILSPECLRGCILIALTLVGLSPVPNAFGVTPAPGGGYPGSNTALGANALFSLTSGIWNTALGYQTLYNDTTGNQNTATGFQALFSITTGSLNTADGAQALYNNTSGTDNAATGFRTLYSNTSGSDNTGTGYESLALNTAGSDNTANGFLALFNNTTGFQNTANGSLSLYSNTTGSYNMASGYQALYSSAISSGNTATGYQALYSNTAYWNAAYGYQALYNNTTGCCNVANGLDALFYNTTGFENTANGAGALASNTTGSYNTGTGGGAIANNTTGSFNVALGFSAGANLTTGDSNIDIGNAGVAGEFGIIRIGTAATHTAAFIAGITGTAVVGNAVVVDANGQLGVLGSSERFKDEIKPMDKASEAIFALKPVTFYYKHELDPRGIPQFGLVAEDVEKVNRDLVTRDAQAKIFTVRYEAVNAMLLNEFLKEHHAVQELKSTASEQEATIIQLKSMMAQQKKDFQTTAAREQEQIEALTAGLQKVSAQVEMNRSAPQMVLNSQ
jgi:uncharacterized coiled-coil protein SlyX